ncbi:MAG: hypothetical protein ACK5UI_07790 [Bacteroidota bacterium]
MNQNLVDKYQINFTNKVNYNHVGNFSYITKVPILNNEFLFNFLFDWSASDLTNVLLPEIDQVLNRTISEYETGSETVSISIFQTKVDFYDYDLNYVGNISTLDFKEICIGWRDFLQTPPLNDTQVES